MTGERLPVTVIVPVKNEEANLSCCLSRLSRFSEVVVVDSSSTDETARIATEHSVTLLNFEWDGRFPKKRNWVLLNHTFANSWVLFLDADERVNDEFCDAVYAATKTDKISGYWLNYSNWFLGQRLRHGLPQRKLALFKIGAGLYERIDEDRWSQLDMEIHEHPIVDGKVGEIVVPIDHRDYKGLGKFIERHRDYALWEAHRYTTLGKNTPAWNAFTPRQRFKYRNLSRWWYPWFYFAFTYVAKLGFLDGASGFYYAFYKAWYFQTIRLLIREQTARQ